VVAQPSQYLSLDPFFFKKKRKKVFNIITRGILVYYLCSEYCSFFKKFRKMNENNRIINHE
jgi:hypothetical protein